jgi:hypothetical protein
VCMCDGKKQGHLSLGLSYITSHNRNEKYKRFFLSLVQYQCCGSASPPDADPDSDF